LTKFDYNCYIVRYVEAIFIHRIFKKIDRKLARSFNFTFCSADDVLPLNNSKCVDYVDRIYPTEFEIKKYHRYSLVYIITRSSPRNWQWGLIKNETLPQKRWFHSSHCELSIYMQQHSSSTCIVSIYLSVFVLGYWFCLFRW